MPEYIPRRIGEILRPPVLARRGARRRALAAVAAPARAPGRRRGRARGGRVRRLRRRRAADRHPLRVPGRRDPVHLLRRGLVRLDAPRRAGTRGGAAGWPARRSCSCALLAYAPSQYRSAHRELDRTRAPAAASKTTCSRSCRPTRSTCAAGPWACPTTRPIPLLALYLKTSPANIVSAQVGAHRTRRLRGPGEHGGRSGLRARPARPARRRQRARRASPSRALNRSWLIFQRCCRASSGPCTPPSRLRPPDACRRPRLRPGSARCACR